MGRGRKRRQRPPREAPLEQNGELVITKVTVEDENQFVVEKPAVRAELMQVPPEDVEEVWPLAEELLRPEFPNVDWSPEEMRHACQSGFATLWMICDENDNALAAMVTVLTPYSGRCTVSICCGDNLWNYLGARTQLYEWAKEQGMREVTFYGRDALVKLMPECKRGGVILRKEL